MGKLALALSCVTANLATSSVCASIFDSFAPPNMLFAADIVKQATSATSSEESSKVLCIRNVMNVWQSREVGEARKLAYGPENVPRG